MKKTLAIILIFSIAWISPNSGIQLQAVAAGRPSAAQEYWEVQFSAEQLENLVAPVALYPDPLLAQVLVAATFPDQIDAASNEIRAYGNGYNVDDAPWDVSVKAVAHYPTVLSMMAEKIDWTTALGQAYVSQSTDLMNAVQRLRRRARNAGNLVTTSQWQIVDTSGYLYIYPAQPQYIYVPVYDPAVVYVSRPAWYTTAIISFGVGLLIGAWLNNDCDWQHHRVYYHGWQHGYGYAPPPVWIQRSRPYVHSTNIYVNNRYRNVVVNRTVVDSSIKYGALNRYNSIHRNVDYSKVRRERRAVGQTPRPPRVETQRKAPTQPGVRTAPAPGTRPSVGERRVPPGQERKQPQVTQPAPRVGERQKPAQATRPAPTTGERRLPPGQQKKQPQATQPAPRVGEREKPAQATRPAPTTGERRVPGQERRQPQITQPAPAQRGNAQVPRTPTAGRQQPAQRGNVQVPRTPTAGGQQPAQRGNVQVPKTPAQRAPESVSRGRQGRTTESGAASQPAQTGRREQSRPAPQVRSVPQQPQSAPQVRTAPQQSRPAPQAASAQRGQGKSGQAPKGRQGDSKGGGQGQEQQRPK